MSLSLGREILFILNEDSVAVRWMECSRISGLTSLALLPGWKSGSKVWNLIRTGVEWVDEDNAGVQLSVSCIETRSSCNQYEALNRFSSTTPKAEYITNVFRRFGIFCEHLTLVIRLTSKTICGNQVSN